MHFVLKNQLKAPARRQQLMQMARNKTKLGGSRRVEKWKMQWKYRKSESETEQVIQKYLVNVI